jgi:hypothetical protein
MNRDTDIGNRLWFVILSLVASIISVVVFITGKNIPDFGNNDVGVVSATFVSPTQKATMAQSTPTFLISLTQTATRVKSTPTFTPTFSTTITHTPTDIVVTDTNDRIGELSVRKPDSNEVRVSDPISLWNANALEVKDMHSPGMNIYFGTAQMGREYLLPVYWCATNSKTLSQNIPLIKTDFYIDDERIPEKYIFNDNYNTNTGWICDYYAVVLDGWENNAQYIFEIKRAILQDISDGKTDYSSGVYVYRLVIQVP